VGIFLMEESELEYLSILKALMELPFQVGKNLLSDFLTGNYSNKSVIKNRLDELDNFDSLGWSKDKIYREVDRLVANGMIELVTSDYNRFVKVLGLTIKGRNEITRPSMPAKKLANRVEFVKTEITDIDRARFEAMDGFLGKFNDEQKKAIISESSKLLCVAGAGSGKTTVLTKRIEFLVKYKGVDPSKILAITFTRKARQEMEKRLIELDVKEVFVHTFNSFCEGILRRHGDVIYGRPIRVQSYGDKILAMNMALGNMGISMEDAISGYFTLQQRKFKTGTQMANSFMNDCFSVMDYFKVSGQDSYDFSKDVDVKNRHNAERIYRITQYLKDHMATQGLRDYSDQIIDATKFLRENPNYVPEFEHVLVDEYQDVNSMQIDLLGLLKPRNLFAVGDPRQSIFGWRGSDVSFILNFGKNETCGSQSKIMDGSPLADGSVSQDGSSQSDGGLAIEKTGVEIVHLTKNYRSSGRIVEFMNHSIKEMGLPDLLAAARGLDTGASDDSSTLSMDDSQSKIVDGSASPDIGRIRILDFDNEEAERVFVMRNIIDGNIPLDEIFVLARTNRQLMELSRLMKAKGINHMVKTDEVRNPAADVCGAVTLATVHAIKGLEAKKVFVIGSNEQNFPCKASDHPAIEMVKKEDYDKEEEERRLFYVAISRAKEVLYVTYSGKKPSYYINDEMRAIANGGSGCRVVSGGTATKDDSVDDDRVLDEGVAGELKSWRSAVSEEKGIPAYLVLSNAVVDELAKVKPMDADELARVKGIGPAKLIEYGARILEIVDEFGGDD